jgi:hypothetical protein
LERDSSKFEHIIRKLARNDRSLYERLEQCAEEIVNFFGLDYENFTIRRILKIDDSSEAPAKRQPPPPPPPADDRFDRYLVNLLANDFSSHRPADEQPDLEVDAPGAAADGVAALQRLMRLGLDDEAAARLLAHTNGDVDQAMTLLLLHTLGLRL